MTRQHGSTPRQYTLFCQRCDREFTSSFIKTLCWPCIAGGATRVANVSGS